MDRSTLVFLTNLVTNALGVDSFTGLARTLVDVARERKTQPDDLTDVADEAKDRDGDGDEKRTVRAGHAKDVPDSLANKDPKSLPRGLRLRNPGLLAKTPIDWKGEIETPDSRYEKFNTYHEGLRAMFMNLKNYQEKHGIKTVKGAISRWAPSHENPTKAYIRNVARALNVEPEEEIDLTNPRTLLTMGKAIIRQENGMQPFSDKTLRKAIRAAL